MQLTRRLPSRVLAGLVFLAFVLCLAPLLYLSRYDVPCADDYIFGTSAHLALAHGGGLGDAITAALEHTAFIYQTWQGSYAAVFLMCLQPAVFSENLYFLTTWLMAAALFGGLFAFCLCLMSKVFGLPRHVGTSLAATIGILYLLLMPYPSETLYWYNGSVYILFFMASQCCLWHWRSVRQERVVSFKLQDSRCWLHFWQEVIWLRASRFSCWH